eukprot:jgi/Hompol1/3105/HPOL_006340-RA
MSYRSMDGAAGNGHLSIVKYLHNANLAGCSHGAMDWASYFGHHETVIWLAENRTEACTSLAHTWSAENGHLELFKYLWREFPGQQPWAHSLTDAARNGHLWVVEFFASVTLEPLDDLLDAALCGGRLELAKILFEKYPSRVHLVPDMALGV